MRYHVYQINLTNEEIEHVNAGAVIPRYGAKTNMMFGDGLASKAADAMSTGYYEHVATIEAEDLNAVFEIGNMGPEENISRFKSMSSVSVGDVITNEDMTKSWVVAPMGFDRLPPYFNKEGINEIVHYTDL